MLKDTDEVNTLMRTGGGSAAHAGVAGIVTAFTVGAVSAILVYVLLEQHRLDSSRFELMFRPAASTFSIVLGLPSIVLYFGLHL